MRSSSGIMMITTAGECARNICSPWAPWPAVSTRNPRLRAAGERLQEAGIVVDEKHRTAYSGVRVSEAARLLWAHNGGIGTPADTSAQPPVHMRTILTSEVNESLTVSCLS